MPECLARSPPTSSRKLRDYAEKTREEPNGIKRLGTTLGIAGNSAYWNLCRIRHRFHAAEHLFDIARAVYGDDNDLARASARQRRDELLAGAFDDMLRAIGADAILALRSCIVSRRLDDFWQRRAARK